MNYSYLEHKLAVHCAGTLLGKKPACLVCFPTKLTHIEEDVRSYLATKPHNLQDLELMLLAKNTRVQYLFVYRRSLLTAYLQDPDVAYALSKFGYEQISEKEKSNSEFDLSAILAQLGARLQENRGFPHEIGLFLGYPVRDVLSFINCGGRDFLTCGYWKVYHNVQQAQARFEEFNACRDCLISQVKAGCDLWSLCADCG